MDKLAGITGEGEDLVHGLVWQLHPPSTLCLSLVPNFLVPAYDLPPYLPFSFCEIRKWNLSHEEMFILCTKMQNAFCGRPWRGGWEQDFVKCGRNFIDRTVYYVVSCSLILLLLCFIVERIFVLLLQKSLFPALAEWVQSPWPGKVQLGLLSWVTVLDHVQF